jgi:thiol-disulfide isomerase/thioredoxin/outer membrane lipoprotein-sorting protein
MRRPLFEVAALTALSMIGAAAAFAQPAPSTSSSEGLELLKQVAQQYVDAKSYSIETVEERTSVGEYVHSWQKTVLAAAEASGNRFHYEGHSHSGGAMTVSDGQSVWTYRVDEHRYTAKPQQISSSAQSPIIAMTEYAMLQAKGLRKRWSDLVRSLKSAERLPDAMLTVNGQQVLCKVVHVQTSDLKRVGGGYTLDETIWIDATHETVLRTEEHLHTCIFSDAACIPIQEETLATFTTTLNGPMRENLFTFTPPADAKLIQDFPDPRRAYPGANMTGEQVPSLKFKSTDGKIVSIESFRGKPVLLDFWATWCGPCVEALPQVAQIYAEAKGKGLVLLTVDRDEEANTAAGFLSKKGYNWPNFHGNGEIEKLVGSSGIPRTMLVGAQGKITYDVSGTDEDQLRTAIVKLGPEYAALSPKPKQTPCTASK